MWLLNVALLITDLVCCTFFGGKNFLFTRGVKSLSLGPYPLKIQLKITQGFAWPKFLMEIPGPDVIKPNSVLRWQWLWLSW